jgi:hypothetical protein
MSKFTPEQYITAYRGVPTPIQDMLDDGDLIEKVVSDIQVNYRLHTDIVGTLEEQVRYLLVGLVNPAEFFGNLMLAGTDEQTAKGIMAEINERIFIPLKQQVSGAASKETAPPVSYAEDSVEESTATPVVPPPTLEYEPVPPVVTLPGSSIPVPTPQTPSPAIAQEAPPAPSIPHTMMNDMVAAQRAPAAPAPVPQASAPLTPAPQPITKEYGVDPYRESI